MKRKKSGEKNSADSEAVVEPIGNARPGDIAVPNFMLESENFAGPEYFARYLQDPLFLETPEELFQPEKSWKINDYLDDVPCDWKGFKIPKVDKEKYRPECELINSSTGVPTKQKSDPSRTQECFAKKIHKKYPKKRKRKNPKKYRCPESKDKNKRKKISKNDRQSDDFEISRRDRIEVRRKMFEENYWKSQLQKRYAKELQSPVFPHQTQHANSKDPRLQRRASMSQTSDSTASSPFPAGPLPRGSREGETTGKARRELFTTAENSAKQRREREYEERLQREFERSKIERGGSNNKPHTWFYSENTQIIKDT